MRRDATATRARASVNARDRLVPSNPSIIALTVVIPPSRAMNSLSETIRSIIEGTLAKKLR